MEKPTRKGEQKKKKKKKAITVLDL
jgi:hypothetical protein